MGLIDRSIATILTITFLSNSIYGLASPFLPTLLDDKGIASSWTGLIFASYAISMVIVSPIVGWLIDKVGHAKIMATGALLMAASIFSFGFTIDIDDNWLLITIAIVLRVFQGKSIRSVVS